MSFADSASEVRERMQTVTRRVGWQFLKPDDVIEAVEETEELETGEPVRVLALLRIRDVRVEPLSRLIDDACYAEDELPREGFPCWTRDDFIERFLRAHQLKTADVDVTRIEFEYVEREPDVTAAGSP